MVNRPKTLAALVKSPKVDIVLPILIQRPIVPPAPIFKLPETLSLHVTLGPTGLEPANTIFIADCLLFLRYFLFLFL